MEGSTGDNTVAVRLVVVFASLHFSFSTEPLLVSQNDEKQVMQSSEMMSISFILVGFI